VLCAIIKASKERKLLFDPNQGDLQRYEVNSLPTGNLPATIRRISYWCLLIGRDWNMVTVSNISNDWQIEQHKLKENLSTFQVNFKDCATYNQIQFQFSKFVRTFNENSSSEISLVIKTFEPKNFAKVITFERSINVLWLKILRHKLSAISQHSLWRIMLIYHQRETNSCIWLYLGSLQRISKTK